jgi:hypothetical protein
MRSGLLFEGGDDTIRPCHQGIQAIYTYVNISVEKDKKPLHQLSYQA